MNAILFYSMNLDAKAYVAYSHSLSLSHSSWKLINSESMLRKYDYLIKFRCARASICFTEYSNTMSPSEQQSCPADLMASVIRFAVFLIAGLTSNMAMVVSSAAI
jgi:hypothetical protein